MKIAVTGKGGVGKTTIAGTLARVLARDGWQVLALDADSNPNLAVSLGVPRQEAGRLVAIPPGMTEWREDASGKAYVHLRQPLQQLIAEYAIPAPDGVRLMVMGEVTRASVGCRCEAHAVARGITGHLVARTDAVVLDMEAGLEHLGRGTTGHVDALLIVVEPYYRALETATRIRDLASQLCLPHILVVANRVRVSRDREAIVQYCQRHDLELVAAIPYDEAIPAAEERGMAPLDYAPHSPGMRAIVDLAHTLQVRLG